MVRSQRITTVKVSCVKSVSYWIHSTLFLISCPTRCLLIKYLILGSLQPPHPVKTMRHIWLSFKSHYKPSSMRSVLAAAASVSSSDSPLDDHRAGDALWCPSAVTHFNSVCLKEGLMKQMLEETQEKREVETALLFAWDIYFLFYRAMWMFSWHSHLRKKRSTQTSSTLCGREWKKTTQNLSQSQQIPSFSVARSWSELPSSPL